MNIQLEGKRALVNGENSGIGAAIALAPAESGAKVAINYVTHPETADEAAWAKNRRDDFIPALSKAATCS